MNTNDLSLFGFRELGMAGDLLTAMSDNKYQDQAEGGNFGSGAKLEFNPNSGEVFIVDDDCKVLMLNGDGKVEEWVTCAECSEEGFKSQVHLSEDGTCTGCKDYTTDPDVCPSSLNGDDKPVNPEETAHKWDETTNPITCAECGAAK